MLTWDDITPPVIQVSDDGSMAYVIVHKKVRRTSKDPSGKETPEAEVYVWLTTMRRVDGRWKITSVTSTNTTEADK